MVLRVTVGKDHALRVTRVALDGERLAYVITANRLLKYRHGRSSIGYIGTTKNGIRRMAESVATHAADLLSRHGVTECEVWPVSSAPLQHVKTWQKLERGLLLVFRSIYGEVPVCNQHGKQIQEDDEFEYFSKQRLESVIRRAEEVSKA